MSQIRAKIEVLKVQTSALATVIPMHDVAVDPSATKGTREKADAVLPYGLTTKGIYERSKTVEGAPKSTFRTALYLAQLNKIQLRKRG